MLMATLVTKQQVLHDMLPEKDRQIVDVPCDAEVMKEVRDLKYFVGAQDTTTYT